jgi:phage gpG-like protein
MALTKKKMPEPVIEIPTRPFITLIKEDLEEIVRQILIN